MDRIMLLCSRGNGCGRLVISPMSVPEQPKGELSEKTCSDSDSFKLFGAETITAGIEVVTQMDPTQDQRMPAPVMKTAIQ